MESEKVMKVSEKKLKEKVFDNFILKICSVILAVVLWLLVINIDDPQVTATIKDIPVQILNEDVITSNDEAYDVLSGNTVDIKITGPRTIVDALRNDDFTATADFNDLSKANSVPIDVAINNSRYETKVNILEKSRNAMRLSVKELIEKEYEVSVHSSGNPAYGYVLYQATPELKSITVKAPEAVHKNISKVTAAISLSGNEIDDFLSQGQIRVYDTGGKLMNLEDNHVTLSNNIISVRGIVYVKKTVDISYTVEEKLKDGRLVTGHEISAKSIDIAGKRAAVDSVERIEIPAELTTPTAETEVNEQGQPELKIDIKELLPEGVYVYGTDGVIILKINVEDEVSRTINIDVKDIGIRKIPDGYEASINNAGSISVRVSGREAELNELDAEKLAPYVDLTGAAEGENIREVNVILPDNVHQITVAQVTVVMTKKNQPPTETDTTQSGGHQEETTTVPPETGTDPEEYESTTPGDA